MIRSLKALQEKIQSLEVERVAAANRFKLLSQRTSTVPMVTTTAGGPHASSSGSDSVGTDPTKGVGLRPQMDTPDVGTSPWLRDTTSHAGVCVCVCWGGGGGGGGGKRECKCDVVQCMLQS